MRLRSKKVWAAHKSSASGTISIQLTNMLFCRKTDDFNWINCRFLQESLCVMRRCVGKTYRDSLTVALHYISTRELWPQGLTVLSMAWSPQFQHMTKQNTPTYIQRDWNTLHGHDHWAWVTVKQAWYLCGKSESLKQPSKMLLF